MELFKWGSGQCPLPKIPPLKAILHDKNYLYRIILVYLASNIAFTTRKHFQAAKFCLPHCLTHSFTDQSHKARDHRKQHTTTIYDTIINSLVGCAFWSSDECAPSAPCHIPPLGCSSSSSKTVSISNRHFP